MAQLRCNFDASVEFKPDLGESDQLPPPISERIPLPEHACGISRARGRAHCNPASQFVIQQPQVLFEGGLDAQAFADGAVAVGLAVLGGVHRLRHMRRA